MMTLKITKAECTSDTKDGRNFNVSCIN